MSPHDQLHAIHAHFTALVQERAAHYGGTLPPEGVPALTEALLGQSEPAWLPVPGMYGGFAYRLFRDDGTYRLQVESWSRVVDGSGQAHAITAVGTTYQGELGV